MEVRTSPLDLLGPADKPALVACPEAATTATVQDALIELGYKVHVVTQHTEFLQRFSQIAYQVVVLDEAFGANAQGNATLQALQNMPMSQRRHATIVLLGSSFQTLHPMQAFQQSVHAVVHRTELNTLGPIVQKVATDNDLFLSTFRETQRERKA
jgi:CheY-like chemotaxis protein